MRINGYRCDACCKEHLLDPTIISMTVTQGMPDAWFTLWQGKLENSKEPHIMFCSLKCLSDWVEKQLVISNRVQTGLTMASGPIAVEAVEDTEHWKKW